MTTGGITRFSIDNLFSHNTEEHRRGILLYFAKFLFSRKLLDMMGGSGERKVVSQSSVKSFPLTVAEKFREEPFRVSLVSGSEMFLLKLVVSRFSVKNFCLTVPKNFVEEPFFVPKKFWYQNISGIRVGGGYHVFSSKLLDLAIPNLLVEELFCVSETLGYRIFLCLRAENNDFPKKLFCVLVPKNFVEQSFSVFTKFLVSKKFMDKIGGGKGYHDFPSKSLCLSISKNFSGIIFSVSIFLGSENFYAYEGNITVFYRKFVGPQYRKTS